MNIELHKITVRELTRVYADNNENEGRSAVAVHPVGHHLD